MVQLQASAVNSLPTEDAHFTQGDEQAALDTPTTADETSVIG
jgi:hypothetical protein